jgi:hypothetical protein
MKSRLSGTASYGWALTGGVAIASVIMVAELPALLHAVTVGAR